MRHGLTGVDHAVVLVHDLDAAEAAWRRIGFAPTPRGVHTLGSMNHCMMFERDYLELLAVPVPHPSMRYFTEYLARAEGLAAFAFSADDGLAAHAAFVRDGVAADPPFEFSRPVPRAGGGDARFRIVQLPEDRTPGMRAFVCQQFTPELVWLPQDTVHPNGAKGLRGVLIACDAPLAAARDYASLAGVSSVAAATDGVHRVGIGDVTFEFARSEVVARRLGGAAPATRGEAFAAAVRVRVRDLRDTAALLAASAVGAVTLEDGALAVPATLTQGVAVVFEA